MKSRKQARNPLPDDLNGLAGRWRTQGAVKHFSAIASGLPDMADFTQEWIEHLKGQIGGRMNIVKDKMDPQSYEELVTDLAWFTFRFARDPDTKMRKVFR